MNTWPTSDKLQISKVKKSIQNFRRTTKMFNALRHAKGGVEFLNPPPPPPTAQRNINRSFFKTNSSSTKSSSNSSLSSGAGNVGLPPFTRHASYSLPPLNTLEIFYHGYPKNKLIIEAATVVLRIEAGEWVTEEERYAIRAKLGSVICRVFQPGTPEFLSWQALLDLWKRIPDS
ncbi:hypothetical protein G9A89_015244 [Geosiphon pyriformis]|nr:hypothetical protein G9A89_015244 [Geosiphon pyriformis]